MTAFADSFIARGRYLMHCLCTLLFIQITQGAPGLGGELNTKGDTQETNRPHIPARRDRGTSYYPVDST